MAAPEGFIADAVAMAEAEGLDGWNIDFEIGAADWNTSGVHGVAAAGQQLAGSVLSFVVLAHWSCMCGRRCLVHG